MIVLKYLNNNLISIKYNGKKDVKNFNKYLKILDKYKLVSISEDGRIYNYSQLESIKKDFKDIVYLNEYSEPEYAHIGDSMKLTPYDYQKEAIFAALKSKELLMVLPCGSGKTIIMIGTYLEAINNNIIKGPGLIVVKSSLKRQWVEEVKKFSDLNAVIIETYSSITSYETSKMNKLKNKKDKESKEKYIYYKNKADEKFNKQFEKEADLFIVNYETLNDEKTREKLKEIGVDTLLSDEIHYVKNKDSKRSKSLKNFNDCIIKIGATATPISKDPQDLFGIFDIIKTDLFESYSKFSKSYMKYAGYGKLIGFKNKEHLQNKIKNNIFVKTKREVASQLPSLNVYSRICYPTDGQLEMHEAIFRKIEELKREELKNIGGTIEENETKSDEISKKILALQTFAQELADTPELLKNSQSDFAKIFTPKDLSSPKMELCLDLISEIIDSGYKVAIFSKFESLQKILIENIKKLYKDIEIATVNGKLSSDQRYVEVYEKFKNNDNCKVLLLSDAGAEGLNLSFCNYLIEFDLAISYLIQTQRHGRLERSDSIFNNVTVYQLILENSYDRIAEKIIKKKKEYDKSLIQSLR